MSWGFCISYSMLLENYWKKFKQINSQSITSILKLKESIKKVDKGDSEYLKLLAQTMFRRMTEVIAQSSTLYIYYNIYIVLIYG